LGRQTALHAKDENDETVFDYRKKHLKKRLFKIVADQTKFIQSKCIHHCLGEKICLQRADLLLHDKDRFYKLLNHPKYPVQIIWAGKPYPMDYSAISTFNSLVERKKS
jgi:starch phosphorylase